jgi:hypothetical protein
MVTWTPETADEADFKTDLEEVGAFEELKNAEKKAYRREGKVGGAKHDDHDPYTRTCAKAFRLGRNVRE